MSGINWRVAEGDLCRCCHLFFRRVSQSTILIKELTGVGKLKFKHQLIFDGSTVAQIVQNSSCAICPKNGDRDSLASLKDILELFHYSKLFDSDR